MILRHLHLPGTTRYSHASRLQERLVAQHLAHKANPNHFPAPPPTIITAQFHPTYTCGRREIGHVSTLQKAHLTAATNFSNERAEFHEALRGGQTTFHGPGQLTAYPILSLLNHKLTPRGYISLLEKSVIETCRQYDVQARSTENPGVWVNDEEKICAVGVHLRRNIASHGIGLNVATDLRWFERIVACGLEGKRTTSLEKHGVEGVSVENVAEVFVEVMVEALQGISEVRSIQERDLELDDETHGLGTSKGF